LFERGDQIIDGYAARFGDASPALKRKERFLPSKTELFFIADNLRNFSLFLEDEGFQLKNMERFREEYYQPRRPTPEWKRFQHVLRIVWDMHNRTCVHLLYTDHEYINLGSLGLETRTRFLFPSGPLRFDSIEDARHLLDRMEFERVGRLLWNLRIVSNESLELSVAAAPGGGATVKVAAASLAAERYRKLFERYKGCVEPLVEPLPAMMLREMS